MTMRKQLVKYRKDAAHLRGLTKDCEFIYRSETFFIEMMQARLGCTQICEKRILSTKFGTARSSKHISKV